MDNGRLIPRFEVEPAYVVQAASVLRSGSGELANVVAVDSQPDRAGSRVDRLDCAEGDSPSAPPEQPPLRDHYLVRVLGMPLVANVLDEADVQAVARANGVPRARRKPTTQFRILSRVSPATPHGAAILAES